MMIKLRKGILHCSTMAAAADSTLQTLQKRYEVLKQKKHRCVDVTTSTSVRPAAAERWLSMKT